MSDPPWAKSNREEGSESAQGVDTTETTPADSNESLSTQSAPVQTPPSTQAEKKRKKTKKSEYVSAVIQSLLDGESEERIVTWLAKKGLRPKQIDEVLERARQRMHRSADATTRAFAAEQEMAHAARQRNLTVGALWLGGGILLTVLTYSSASASGGSYVLAWGPILYGLMRIARSG